MTARTVWLWLCLVSASCRAPEPTVERVESPGARAMRAEASHDSAGDKNQVQEPASSPVESPAEKSPSERSHLSLAAAHLENGDLQAAEPHLARYVAAHPEHLIVRAHYAELLLRLKKMDRSRIHFERFIAEVQEIPAMAAKHLVHCHSRLMEIAEAQGDEYAEHLHRGIGLCLLARERGSTARDEEVELSVESVLCKAAGELTLARQQRREEARPAWYLHEVWKQLDQSRPADRYLREAEAAAPFSYLTPLERRQLQLAWHAAEQDDWSRRTRSR